MIKGLLDGETPEQVLTYDFVCLVSVRGDNLNGCPISGVHYTLRPPIPPTVIHIEK